MKLLEKFRSKTKKCPNCGAELSKSAKLCPECGHSFFKGEEKLLRNWKIESDACCFLPVMAIFLLAFLVWKSGFVQSLLLVVLVLILLLVISIILFFGIPLLSLRKLFRF